MDNNNSYVTVEQVNDLSARIMNICVTTEQVNDLSKRINSELCESMNRALAEERAVMTKWMIEVVAKTSAAVAANVAQRVGEQVRSSGPMDTSAIEASVVAAVVERFDEKLSLALDRKLGDSVVVKDIDRNEAGDIVRVVQSVESKV